MKVDRSAPFFSVIVPVYNRVEELRDALLSVRMQTFANYECIIVDDGSENGREVATLVDSLSDPRFSYVRRENGGGSAARNSGLDAAKGLFAAFLDSDDVYLPEKLQLDYGLLQTATHHAVVFAPVIVDRGDNVFATKPHRGPKHGERIDLYLCARDGWTQTSTIVVSASLARNVRFDERLHFGQDTDFAIRCAEAGGTFIMHNEPTVIWRDRATAGRVSANTRPHEMLGWLETLEGTISRRAARAYRGWHVARMFSERGQKMSAFTYYLIALFTFSFGLRVAAKALLQICMSRGTYRRIVDLSLKNKSR